MDGKTSERGGEGNINQGAPPGFAKGLRNQEECSRADDYKKEHLRNQLSDPWKGNCMRFLLNISWQPGEFSEALPLMDKVEHSVRVTKC